MTRRTPELEKINPESAELCAAVAGDLVCGSGRPSVETWPPRRDPALWSTGGGVQDTATQTRAMSAPYQSALAANAAFQSSNPRAAGDARIDSNVAPIAAGSALSVPMGNPASATNIPELDAPCLQPPGRRVSQGSCRAGQTSGEATEHKWQQEGQGGAGHRGRCRHNHHGTRPKKRHEPRAALQRKLWSGDRTEKEASAQRVGMDPLFFRHFCPSVLALGQ